MSLARAISRGALLKARLAVNGIQWAARSLGTAMTAAPAGVEGLFTPLTPLLSPLPLPEAAATNPASCNTGNYRPTMAEKPDKSNRLKARLPRGLDDRGAAEIAA